MKNPEDISFEELGFKGGLEIHHQINAERKLFCNCKPERISPERVEKPDYTFERFFRPVLGEMGDFDPGMLIEYEKGYRVIYHAYNDVDCIYEQDEQPPFPMDMGSVYRAYELAHWFDSSALVEELIVARKQYLDGSITTGFQRTAIVARDGYVMVNGKKVRISNLTVEEDSARKIKTENFGRTVYYNLDRLGMPLVEVITDHMDVDNAEDLRKAAEMIGLVLRQSGIGKRGIGTARQDVNISITGGDRVEIKGVQDLDMFDKMARHECVRQDMLIKLAKELNTRGLNKNELDHIYFDLSEHFEGILQENYVVMGIKLSQFSGVLGTEIQPGRDFGRDIFEKASLISGVQVENLFHSDEMDPNSQRRKDGNTNYCIFFGNIDEKLDGEIRETLGIGENDAYVLGLGPQNWVIHAMKKIVERTKMALDGVPQETRRILPDGNTEFLRVIHGKQRLYPDTDSPPITIDMQKVEDLRKFSNKDKPWDLVKRFAELGFSYEQMTQVIRHDNLEIFLQLVEKYEPKQVYSLLEQKIYALRKQGIKIPKDFDYTSILEAELEGTIDGNILPELVTIMAESNLSLEQALVKLSVNTDGLAEILSTSFEKLKDQFSKWIEDKKERARLIAAIRKDLYPTQTVSGKHIQQFLRNKEA